MPLHWWPDDGRFLPLRCAAFFSRRTAPARPSSRRCATASRSCRHGDCGGASPPASPPGPYQRTPSVGWSLYAVIATYMLPPVALACRSTWCSAWARPAQQCLRRWHRLLTILAALRHLADEIRASMPIPSEIEQARRRSTAPGCSRSCGSSPCRSAAPVMATAALFALLLAWDEFFYALLFT